jgi:hypothetical protein
MTKSLPNAPVRHVVLVALLSLACAFCTGCHSSAKNSAAAPAGVSSTVAAWQSQAPAAPFDDRPITTMETVGANGD